MVCLADCISPGCSCCTELIGVMWFVLLIFIDCISLGCSCCTELIGVMWFVLLTVFPQVAHVVLN